MQTVQTDLDLHSPQNESVVQRGSITTKLYHARKDISLSDSVDPKSDCKFFFKSDHDLLSSKDPGIGNGNLKIQLIKLAHNEQFLLFPQCFLLNQKIVSPFVNILNIISVFAAEMEEPKTGM